MSGPCSVCGTRLLLHSNLPDAESYTCPNCGSYTLMGTLVAILDSVLSNNDSSALLSHAIRKMQRVDEPVPVINSDSVESLIQGKLPSPAEQANALIIWLGDNLDGAGASIDISPDTHKAIIGANSSRDFHFVAKYLYDNGYLNGALSLNPLTGGNVGLTFEGWEHYHELMEANQESTKVFMAMGYGDTVLDKVVDSVFRDAVKQTGFELFRLDDQPKAGLIDDRMRIEIRTSCLLLSDLTHDNPGAYWEAGYAEGLNIPVIYTCEESKFKKEKSHFDTNHHLTVVWNADKPEKTAELLKATIRATLPESAKLTDD